MKLTASRIIAPLANIFLSLLRNRQNLRLSREEFRWSHISFSLFGEDLAVGRWLSRYPLTAKFYVDAGAHDPVQCSNTLLLHKQGWRGINIDMDSKGIGQFNRLRPNDINVVAALSGKAFEMTRFFYGENSQQDRLGGAGDKEVNSLTGRRPVKTEPVMTTTLSAVLADASCEEMGYLNIDCEGHDLEVLKGLDLTKFRPRVITIEAETDVERKAIDAYLSDRGYQLKEILEMTSLFVLKDE